MTTKLTLLGPAARNKHGQACVRVQCSCGSPEFVVRKDSFDQNRSTSCGFCRRGGRKVKTAPVTAPVIAPVPAPESTPHFKRGTPDWYADQIASKEAAALVLEIDIKKLQESITDLLVLKAWTAECAAFDKLNHQISRLMTAKDKAETGTVKSNKTQAELTKERIAALRGNK
jgi:hypothetical protein